MKSFKQFLREAVSYNTKGFPALRKFLLAAAPTQSQELFDAQYFLYRGIRSWPPSNSKEVFWGGDDDYVIRVFEVKVRKDRKSMDIEPDIHKALDNWFNDNGFGRPRSQGAFVFGGPDAHHDVKSYGTAYAIFPTSDTTEYVWSPKVDDMYNKTHHYAKFGDTMGVDKAPDPELLDAFMKKANYVRNSDVFAAANQSNEIMMMADSFYAVTVEETESGHRVQDPKLIKELISTHKAGE